MDHITKYVGMEVSKEKMTVSTYCRNAPHHRHHDVTKYSHD